MEQPILKLAPEERIANFVCLVCETPLEKGWTYFRCTDCQFSSAKGVRWRLYDAKPYKPATLPPSLINGFASSTLDELYKK